MATTMEPGKQYRLKRNFEVRTYKGSLKHQILFDTVVVVKKVDASIDQVWVEGIDLPVPLAAFQNAVTPV
jgi:hypothetical protein